MTPLINQTMLPNSTELRAETKGELLQWVWGPFNFERLVIISLILQFILFFGAPYRKSTGNGMLLTLIWSSYLLADWVSYYSIGLVLNGETGPDTNHLHILWGSLLLAHLSGPDSISVLDMEDHQLWSRTALKFSTIAYSTARVMIKAFSHKVDTSLPNKLNRLSHEQVHKLLYGPTVILFVVGVTKSLEKIATLMFNRTVVFQDHVMRNIHANPSNAMLVEGAVRVKVDKRPIVLDSRTKELTQFESLRDAYRLFKVFKGCYVDFKFDFEDGGSSIKEYFLNRSPQNAFQVIETELNLMYDVFYTKASNFRKPGVRFSRYLIVIAEFVAFGCLASNQLQDIGNWFDAPITYILILGALFMDTISTLYIIFSIRTIIQEDEDEDEDESDDNHHHNLSVRVWILNKLLGLRRRTWGKHASTNEISCVQLIRRVLFKRWSESISQFNFIDYCLRRQPRKLQNVLNFLGVKEKIIKATYVSHVWFTDSLRDFIFEELKSKAIEPDKRSELYMKWVAGEELDKCLVIFHIATEFCWNNKHDEDNGEEAKYREWSRILSNYMLCLLVQHPKMLRQPEVALMGRIRIESAYEKAVSILRGERLKLQDEACGKLLDHVMENVESYSERDGLMFKAYRLSEEMKDHGSGKWKVMSKVWMELMCRVAGESKPSWHTRTLNKGGELVTLVWLLMIHLGIDNQTQIS